MKIIYKKGNLVDAEEHCIAHGCNAQGVMGSGVAKAIKEKWPQAFVRYRAQYESPYGLQLGRSVYYAHYDPEHPTIEEYKLIVNCITQEFYGKDGKKYVSYDAIHTCIKGINDEARGRKNAQNKPLEQNPFDSFAIPKIGAGYGGGSWEVIAAIIEDVTTDVQPVVYEL